MNSIQYNKLICRLVLPFSFLVASQGYAQVHSKNECRQLTEEQKKLKFDFQSMACSEPESELELQQLSNSLSEAYDKDPRKALREGWGSRTLKKIAHLNPSFDLDAISFTFFDGLRIKAGYSYDLSPSFAGGLYTRSDRYFFRAGYGNSIHEWSNVEDDNKMAGFSAGVSNDLEITFARQFKNEKSALVAVPYFYSRIPLTAEKALKNLKPSDFVSFRANMGFHISGSALMEITGIGAGQINASATYAIRGGFQLHLLRLQDNKIRFKLSAVRNREFDARLGIRAGEVIEIFEVSAIDKTLRSVYSKPIEAFYKNGTNNLAIADYTMDLSRPEMAEAYNEVIKSALKFEQFRIVNPITSNSGLNQNLAKKIQPLDQIYREDFIAGTVGRIVRNNKATAVEDYSELGLISKVWELFKWRFSGRSSDINIHEITADESSAYYSVETHDQIYRMSSLFGWIRESTTRGVTAVFSADRKFNKLDAEGLTIRDEKRDARQRPKEYAQVKRSVEMLVPKEISEKIDWSQFEQPADKTWQNAAMRSYLLFSAKAFDLFPQLDAKQIRKEFSAYLEKFDLTDVVVFRKTDTARGGSQDLTLTDKLKRLEDWLPDLSKKIAKVLNKSLPDSQRLEQFMDLRKSHVFNQLGASFLVHLLAKNNSESDLKSAISYRLELEASEKNPATDKNFSYVFEFGDVKETDLFRRVLYLKYVLSTDGVDIQKEAEGLGLIIKDQLSK
jgi:hypothetical protein